MAKEYSELVEENEQLKASKITLLEACKEALRFIEARKEPEIDRYILETLRQAIQNAEKEG